MRQTRACEIQIDRMLTLISKPSEVISKFRLRMGIILLILGSGLLVLGILAVSHTRENGLMHEGIVRRIQDKMAGLSAAPFQFEDRQRDSRTQ